MVERLCSGRFTVGCLALLVWGLASVGCGDDDGTGSSRLRILVINDDGVEAEGIDALVEGLIADSRNDVVVSAPDGNRSGSGNMTGPSERCGDLSVSAASTRSGYPATAINGCPADAVNYALDSLYPDGDAPDVVISGINEGQNVSELIAGSVSGTVGAARRAARSGVPALAASQGRAESDREPDYPAGVEAVLVWVDDNRDDLIEGAVTTSSIDNLNIPSCAVGTIRGTLVVPLAALPAGALSTQDCESTLESPGDDVEALNNGFVTLTTIPVD